MEASKMYRLNKIQQMLLDYRAGLYTMCAMVLAKFAMKRLSVYQIILKIILSAINNRTASLVMLTVRRGKQCWRTHITPYSL